MVNSHAFITTYYSYFKCFMTYKTPSGMKKASRKYQIRRLPGGQKVFQKYCTWCNTRGSRTWSRVALL